MSNSNLQRELSRFFVKTTLASTYKPYFLKALLELTDYDDPSKHLVYQKDWIRKTNEGLEVKLDFIASRFGYYYWDPHFKFNLRQSPNRSDDVHIHIILKEFRDMLTKNKRKASIGHRPKITVFCSPKYSQIRSRIISRCIKPDVLWRLLKDCKIYSIGKNGASIIVPYEILEHVKRNKSIIEEAINFVITAYLEKCNNSPQIATKISEQEPVSQLPKNVFAKISSLQKGLCFYCNKRTGLVQEHVIPKDYVWETKPYNIVGACKECNGKKWYDKLPSESIFDEILTRNDSSELSELMRKASYSRESYELQYKNCHLDYTSKYWQPS